MSTGSSTRSIIINPRFSAFRWYLIRGFSDSIIFLRIREKTATRAIPLPARIAGTNHNFDCEATYATAKKQHATTSIRIATEAIFTYHGSCSDLISFPFSCSPYHTHTGKSIQTIEILILSSKSDPAGSK
jgi:hypothetical protein